MNLLLLHGPPAAGKYTVGHELTALTGYRFFHNHLVVDAVRAVYDFGTPGFVDLREKIWREVFGRAARDRLPGLIFTFNPENTVRQEFIDWLFTGLASAGVTVFSVELSVSEDEIERRIGAASRRECGKLTDVDLYRRLRADGSFTTPVIPRSDLRIDTEKTAARDSARLIARALGFN